jgi:hypothetical protein
MTDFLPPPPQKILSNIATAAEGVVIEQQKITYTSDDPKLTRYQNSQRRHIEAIMNKQVELLRDPEHLKFLADVKENAEKRKPRGRPPKTQSSSQPEKLDWLKPQYDPFRNSQIIKSQDCHSMSDDDDEDYTTNSNAERNFGDAERGNSDKNLRSEIPAEVSTPTTGTGYQEGKRKS